MMLPIDPDADSSRRAWPPCPACHHGDGCPDCESSRNCSVHWQYLLRNEGKRVFMQCAMCAHLWTADTSAKRLAQRHIGSSAPKGGVTDA
jgi:hypothetical protein